MTRELAQILVVVAESYSVTLSLIPTPFTTAVIIEPAVEPELADREINFGVNVIPGLSSV